MFLFWSKSRSLTDVEILISPQGFPLSVLRNKWTPSISQRHSIPGRSSAYVRWLVRLCRLLCTMPLMGPGSLLVSCNPAFPRYTSFWSYARRSCAPWCTSLQSAVSWVQQTATTPTLRVDSPTLTLLLMIGVLFSQTPQAVVLLAPGPTRLLLWLSRLTLWW